MFAHIIQRKMTTNRSIERTCYCCLLLFVFFIMELTLYYVAKQPAVLKLQQVVSLGIKVPLRNDEMNKLPQSNKHAEIIRSIHNYSNSMSDVFDMNGDIRIHRNSSTIFVDLNMSRSWAVRTYARKYVVNTDWSIQTSKNTTEFPDCNKNFNTTAILFSSGPFIANNYHSFADVLFPLYITSRQFNRTLLFLMSNAQPWWLLKFEMIMEKLTKYDIMDIDKENEVLCFSRLIVGLKADKELVADSNVSPNYSINSFRQFLRETYSLETEAIDNKKCGSKRPRMLIISRKNSRRLRNGEEIEKMARNLGADVSLQEMEGDVSITARHVNSFDVLIGVHGAGLANMLFLPDNAVLVQIVPFALDFWSGIYFEKPSRAMKLRYLEYKISLNESSLLEKYHPNDQVCTNPGAVYGKGGYRLFQSIYFDDQDVTLDLVRFNATLLKALKLVQCKILTIPRFSRR